MSYKCKECGSRVTDTNSRAEVRNNNQTLGSGKVYKCTNCTTIYIALRGSWYKQVLNIIEPLADFN